MAREPVRRCALSFDFGPAPLHLPLPLDADNAVYGCVPTASRIDRGRAGVRASAWSRSRVRRVGVSSRVRPPRTGIVTCHCLPGRVSMWS